MGRLDSHFDYYVVCRRNPSYNGVLRDFFESEYWRRILDGTSAERFEKPVLGYNVRSFAFAVPWRLFGRVVRPVMRLRAFSDVNGEPALIVDPAKSTLGQLREAGFVMPLLYI